MKRYISSLLIFVMLFSLFTPIIEATENNISEDIYNEENYIQTSENIVATIPKDSESLRSDLGVDSLIADIKSFNTFLLRQPKTNTVEIDVSSLDSSNLDVLHFIEDVDAITEEMGILDISDYSENSKTVLANAISAYQEKYASDKECVVVEIFEDLSVENGSITFNVGSFSIFAIGEFNINTYEFYVDGTLHNVQVLIGDDSGMDTLIVPETPYKENSEFLGWQIEGLEDYQNFGLIDVISGADVVKCNAVFNDVRYVYFLYEAKEGGYVLDTLSGKPGDVIYTDQVDYPINLDKHVISWHTDVNLTSAPVTNVTLDNGDITLYPNIQEGHWLTFYSNGGSVVEPHFYAINESVTAPIEPQKEGYKFTGWYDENDVLFEFNGQMLSESSVLYASWQPLQVKYTVQIMLQDPNILTDYNPVNLASFEKEGAVESEIVATSVTDIELETLINNLKNNNYFKKNLKYFYLDNAKNANSKVVVSGDGSSVLYVYYSRYPYTINFYLTQSDYNSKTLYKSITGRFDSDLPFSDWSEPTETELPNFMSWYDPVENVYVPWTGYYNNSYASFDSTLNEWVINFYAATSKARKWATYYYLQTLNPDGTVADVGYTLTEDYKVKPDINALTPIATSSEIFKNNWSKLEIDNSLGVTSDVTANNSWTLYSINNYAKNGSFGYWDDPIAGFTLVAFALDGFAGNGLSGEEYDIIRTTARDAAYLSYIDDNVKIEASQPMESGKWYAVSPGISLTQICGHLYCRYLRNIYNLEFIADGNNVKSFDVYYETDLSLDKFTNVSEELIAPDGYKFGGWYTSADLSENTKFDLTKNTMPANDIKLYAKWIPKIVDIDVHITLDGSDTIIEGVNGFTVKYGEKVDRLMVESLKTSVNMPSEALWFGWFERVNVGGGKTLLVPFNFDKQLIKDLVLYPFYSYTTPVQLKYNLNGGSGIVPVDNNNYALGKGAVVLSNTDIIPPNGKVFVSWNTKADGTGKSYFPGDIALIDIDDMSLYAIYEKDTKLDTVSLIYINTLSLEEKLFEYKKSDNISIKDNSIFNIPTSSKYIFKNWNTEIDGSGISYNTNDLVYLTGQDNKLYTVWDENLDYIPPSKPKLYNYTIYYKDVNGNDILDKEEYKGKLNEIIIANPKEIEGYISKDKEKSLKITRNSKDNIIVFIYIEEYKVPEHKYLDYTLNHKLYIVGYEDGTVRPENNITRAESATIFYRLLKDEVQNKFRTNYNKFIDVNENDWFNTSVSTLTNMGMINGYSDSTFRPNQYITRAEFITLMVGFFETDIEEVNNKFTDVSEKDWFYNTVLIGADKGYIAGYPDGSFKPNQYITRAEACKIVNKVLDRRPTKPGLYENLIDWPDLDENAWYYLDVIEATHSHIADYNYFKNNLENWNR